MNRTSFITFKKHMYAKKINFEKHMYVKKHIFENNILSKIY